MMNCSTWYGLVVILLLLCVAAACEGESDIERLESAQARWEKSAPEIYRLRLTENGGWSWNDRFLTASAGFLLAEEFLPVGGRMPHGCGSSSGCCLHVDELDERGLVALMFDSVQCFEENEWGVVRPAFDSSTGLPLHWGRDDPKAVDEEELYTVSEFRAGSSDCNVLCRGDRPCVRDDQGCVVDESVRDDCPPHDTQYAAALQAASRCEVDEDCYSVWADEVRALDCALGYGEESGAAVLALGEGGYEALLAHDFMAKWQENECLLNPCWGMERWGGESRCVDGVCRFVFADEDLPDTARCFGGRIFDRPAWPAEPSPLCAATPDCTFGEEPGCLCFQGYCYVRREP